MDNRTRRCTECHSKKMVQLTKLRHCEEYRIISAGYLNHVVQFTDNFCMEI